MYVSNGRTAGKDVYSSDPLRGTLTPVSRKKVHVSAEKGIDI